MCAIWQLLLKAGLSNEFVARYYEAFKQLQPRGPDRSHFVEHSSPFNIFCGFHRLSIMDPTTHGDQPFTLEYTGPDGIKHIIVAMTNGEIYNFNELIHKYELDVKSHSDCEVIPHLFHKLGIERMMREILGEFAFIISDMNTQTGDMVVYASRDPFGIKPLFYTETDTYINLSSEMKGLVNIHTKSIDTERVEPIIPGNYYKWVKNAGTWSKPEITQYYSCANIPTNQVKDLTEIKASILSILTEAVRCRLVADRPVGCLLSGGLDSSLVASIASRILKTQGKQLKTFSIGMEGSTDEYYARMVSAHIGSDHTHVTFTQEEWLSAVSQVIKVTETYDITTVRASAGQYLISKWIRANADPIVLLIGDGSDELAAGYLYFHKSPSPEASHDENVRLLTDISYFDVLRADRGVSSNGLEARVPFLDVRFVNYYLSVDPTLRCAMGRIEKWLLRESFNGLDYLPEPVLFRKKEAFSDGVSSVEKSWYKILQESIEQKYSEEDLKIKQATYTHNVPPSKEALYFREIYEEYFTKKTDNVIPYYWLPKWCGQINEPSARVLAQY